MSARRALRAARAVLGPDVGAPHRLAAGRSCEAFGVVARGEEYVVRVPVVGTDRSIRFRAEATIGDALADRGHPVARWAVVDVDGVACAVGRRLPGVPVDGSAPWTTGFSTGFSAGLGRLLADLHAVPANGFGPLIDTGVDDAGALRGEAGSAREGVLRRWCWARCWPFDDVGLADHPVSHLGRDVVPRLPPSGDVLDAAGGPVGVVHSDLHREHLLVGPTGDLTGVLDFGDAFVGAVAWDVALLHWYYGARAAADVARHDPGGQDALERARLLAVAVGLYKLAKNPADPQVPVRLARVLDDVRA